MTAAAHCFNHPERLAAARCPECRNSFCRECVTEHEGRLSCAACLRKHPTAAVQRVPFLRHLALPTMAVAALLGSWLLFYTAGWWLENLTMPAPSEKVTQR
jgi:hypothetical protein